MSACYVSGVGLLVTTHTWTSTAKEVSLATSGYTPNVDDTNVSVLGANELSGGGYARVALANPTTTNVPANDRVEFDADDTVFTSLGAAAGTPAYAVISETTGGALIAYSTLTAPPAPNGGNYTIQWGATGCFVFNIIP